MGSTKLWLFGVSVVLCGVTEAQIGGAGVWVPGYQEPMPKYWTGTLNLAKGSAVSEGGWIDKAILWIRKDGGNWQQVRQWTDDPDPGGPMAMGLSVAFDSTHFNDGDLVFVKYQVLDYVYGYLPTNKEATASAVVHNNAFIYQHSGYESDGATPARDSLSSMSYDALKRAQGWAPSIVELDTYDAAVFYFHAHGDPTLISDYLGMKIFPSDVLDWREQTNGSGYPPQNSTGRPLTQYVHLDACSAAYDNSYANWFWPYYRVDFPGGPCINQAVFGYAGSTLCNERVMQAGLYWPKLEAGRTVVEMRDDLVLYCQFRWLWYNEHYIHVERPAGTWWHVDEASDCPIWGDWYTRLKGVYTGNTTWPPGWHRNI